MRVHVVAVGRSRGVFADPIQEYEERCARYWKFDVTEVAAGAKSPEPRAIQSAEAERILKALPGGLSVVPLTRVGRQLDSRELSSYLDELAVRSSAGVAFVIGGAYGLDESVLRRSDRTLSLSPMTLPHELARLVLAEQLYRAGTISRGEPYHKG